MTDLLPSDPTEGTVSSATPSPPTRRTLATDLLALGLEPGSTVLLPASLSALGWVAPAAWGRPPIPEAWWPVVRAEMPAYEAAITPSRGMGVIAEQVRTWPGAARSAHSQNSFAAVGPRAAEVTGVHDLAGSLDERSPLRTLESGTREWVEYDDVELDESDFQEIGTDFERERPELVVEGTVGSAPCLLFPLVDAVAYAVGWMSTRGTT